MSRTDFDHDTFNTLPIVNKLQVQVYDEFGGLMQGVGDFSFVLRFNHE